MQLISAYGRDYKTCKEVKSAWFAGKDFIVADITSKWSGKYTSCRDDHTSVEICYNALRDICVINTKDKP